MAGGPSMITNFSFVKISGLTVTRGRQFKKTVSQFSFSPQCRLFLGMFILDSPGQEQLGILPLTPTKDPPPLHFLFILRFTKITRR